MTREPGESTLAYEARKARIRAGREWVVLKQKRYAAIHDIMHEMENLQNRVQSGGPAIRPEEMNALVFRLAKAIGGASYIKDIARWATDDDE